MERPARQRVDRLSLSRARPTNRRFRSCPGFRRSARSATPMRSMPPAIFTASISALPANGGKARGRWNGAARWRLAPISTAHPSMAQRPLPPARVATTSPGGLLALSSNIGNFSQTPLCGGAGDFAEGRLPGGTAVADRRQLRRAVLTGVQRAGGPDRYHHQSQSDPAGRARRPAASDAGVQHLIAGGAGF